MVKFSSNLTRKSPKITKIKKNRKKTPVGLSANTVLLTFFIYRKLRGRVQKSLFENSDGNRCLQRINISDNERNDKSE